MLNKISWSARIVVRAEIETRSGGSLRTARHRVISLIKVKEVWRKLI